MRNVLFVLSGPSGVGKGTVAKILAEKDEIALSISCTTRAPRVGETNGKEYFFISKQDFESLIEKDGLLEFSNHFGNFYGTPKDFVLKNLEEKDVLLEIDVNGGLKVKENFPDVILIMLAPPSVDEVYNRLVKRNTESPDKIAQRMKRIEYELDMAKYYDYVVVNDKIEEAVKEIEQILNIEKTNNRRYQNDT